MQRWFVLAAVGLGIGIAFGIEIAAGRHFYGDPETDSNIGGAPGDA